MFENLFEPPMIGPFVEPTAGGRKRGTRVADMCRNGVALVRPAIYPWFRIRFCRKNTNMSHEAEFRRL